MTGNSFQMSNAFASWSVENRKSDEHFVLCVVWKPSSERWKVINVQNIEEFKHNPVWM